MKRQDHQTNRVVQSSDDQRKAGQLKLIILGAGYATRLYPLTFNQPKRLLEVAGKPMGENVRDNLNAITGIDQIYAVPNASFARQLATWSAASQQPPPG